MVASLEILLHTIYYLYSWTYLYPSLSGVTKPVPGSRITCADDHRVIWQRDEVIRDCLRRTTSRYDYLSIWTNLHTSLSGVTKPAPGSKITCADDHRVIRQHDEVIQDRLRRTTSKYDYLSTLTYIHTCLRGVMKPAPGSRRTCADDQQIIQQCDEVIRDCLQRTTSRYDYLSTLIYLHTSLSGVTRAVPGSRITRGDDHRVMWQRDECVKDCPITVSLRVFT